MILERMKQSSAVKRQYGVHGRMIFKMKDGTKHIIYTLESPWDWNQDEKNGIVGLSCIAEGSYQIVIEKSPLHNLELPFLVNPSLNVQLRQKTAAIDRTGHALCHLNDIDVHHIYGRYILIGSDTKYSNLGFYEPIEGHTAYVQLMEYLRESGDRNLTIKWL